MNRRTLLRWLSPGYLLRRAWRAVRIGFYAWTIFEHELYLMACARDGLINSLSLSHFRRDIEMRRVRLARLYAE